VSRTAELHAVLETIQRSEKRHRLIGSKHPDGRPTLLDEVCRGCPSRKRCRTASVALADLESRIL
jgi:hypothetical protein